jgi:hypothetical protein
MNHRRTPLPILLTATCLVVASSFAANAPTPNTSPAPSALAEEKAAEATVTKKFLHSTKDTYGWMPVKGNISYDFFPDGRLHIQGPDGEATMWEGKWSLKGDQLTVTNSTKKETKTYTATIDGADLLLDGKRYKRHKATE